MPDMTTIQGAVSGIKAACDIAASLVGLAEKTELKLKLSDLVDKLLSAQASILAVNEERALLLERIRVLEEKAAQAGTWEHEMARYQLVSPWTGVTVYALKKSESRGEPPHFMCANCYHQRKPSILQNGATKDGKWGLLVCPVCRAETRTGYRPGAPRHYAEDIEQAK